MKRLALKIALTVTIALSHLNYFSQDSIKLSKKILSAANDAYERSDFLNAFKMYSQVLKYDTSNYDAIYRSGVCLFSINKTDSVPFHYFLKAKDKIAESHFYLGRMYHHKNEIKKALEEFFYFKTINREEEITSEEVTRWIRICENALREESRRENYSVKNLGSLINTKYPEYVPLVWNVNGSLVFTSRRADSKGGQMDPYGKYYEDIYLSQNSPGGWTNPLPISDSINSKTHDACVAFSPSGNELIIYRTDEKQTGGDLYISSYNGSSWSAPVMLGPEINSPYLEASACFSADGNEIIFSSNRPGGLGGKDLYRIRKFMNGKFSLPFNLGPAINTSEDEDAPFIDKKDNSLYFSSKGHDTMGEYDIFGSAYNAETDRWGKAENLGPPINSTNDDIYFIKPGDKETALFASRREGGFGDADIYEVNFAETNQLVVYCRLNLTAVTKEELKDLQLSLYDATTGKLEGVYRPNKNYMAMVLVVDKTKSYKIIVESAGIDPILKRTMFSDTEKEISIDLIKKVK